MNNLIEANIRRRVFVYSAHATRIEMTQPSPFFRRSSQCGYSSIFIFISEHLHHAAVALERPKRNPCAPARSLNAQISLRTWHKSFLRFLMSNRLRWIDVDVFRSRFGLAVWKTPESGRRINKVSDRVADEVHCGQSITHFLHDSEEK